MLCQWPIKHFCAVTVSSFTTPSLPRAFACGEVFTAPLLHGCSATVVAGEGSCSHLIHQDAFGCQLQNMTWLALPAGSQAFPRLGPIGGQHPSRQCVRLQPVLCCSVSHMPHSQWDKEASWGTGLPGNCVFHASLHWSSNNIIIEIRDRKALLGHCVNTLPVPDCDLPSCSR